MGRGPRHRKGQQGQTTTHTHNTNRCAGQVCLGLSEGWPQNTSVVPSARRDSGRL